MGSNQTNKTNICGYVAFAGNTRSGSLNIGARVAAGLTTGALAVFIAQPTDVVKVRLQAAAANTRQGAVAPRYNSTIQAYKIIANSEGMRGLWKGIIHHIFKHNL